MSCCGSFTPLNAAMKRFFTLLAFGLLALGVARADDTAKAQPKPYPLTVCVVSGQKLGPQTYTFDQAGYEVKLASKDYLPEFQKSPMKYLAKLAQAYKSAKPYPVGICVVCGMQLDSTCYTFVYDGRQFKICDPSELDDFNRDPNKYVKIWDAATARVAKEKAAAGGVPVAPAASGNSTMTMSM
jgi:YHS domain-containing protein